MSLQSEKSFPFDANEINGQYDRVYMADDFARYFRAFISSGVFIKESDNLQVIANNDMTVTLRPGTIIVDGYRYDNLDDIIIELKPADGVLNRIDRVAVTWDKEKREIHYSLLEGNPAYEAVPTEKRRTAEYKDYILADIFVAAGEISISQVNITDQRLNADECGVAAPFIELDTTNFYKQLEAWKKQEQAAFDIWFQKIKDQLTEDAVGNLQMQIDGKVSSTTVKEIKVVSELPQDAASHPEILYVIPQ